MALGIGLGYPRSGWLYQCIRCPVLLNFDLLESCLELLGSATKRFPNVFPQLLELRLLLRGGELAPCSGKGLLRGHECLLCTSDLHLLGLDLSPSILQLLRMWRFFAISKNTISLLSKVSKLSRTIGW